MRTGALLLVLFLALLAVTPAAARDLVPVPPNTLVPTDPDGDGKHEDLNANVRKDFADVVLYFNQLTWLAANEPVAEFDYNDNGRIDFADVVSLFNELGATGPAVLISQSLAPSAEDRTLAGAGVNLTVPGGALERAALVRVATVPSPPAPPAGTSNLTVYDITIGDQERFAPGIVIEIPYRSSMVPTGYRPDQAIQEVRWDAQAGEWVEIPTAIDTSRGVVVLETDHLCVAGFTAVLQPGPVTELYAIPFVIHFDPADDAAIAKAWQGSGNYTAADALASRVRDILWDANTRYRETYGFQPPVPSRFTGDGFIHVYVGDYYESGWNPTTKTITVSREPFLPGPGADLRLEAEMRHELFHAVQNAYVSVAWMNGNRWWTEATAEYASTYLLDWDPSPLFPIDSAFFSKPLTTVDSYHEYQTAQVVHQLLNRQPPTFRELWTSSTTYGSAYDAVDAWGLAHSRSLEATYRNMMAAHLATTDDPPAVWARVRQPVLDGASPLPGSSSMHVVLSGQGTGTVTPAYRVSTGGATEATLVDAWSGGGGPLPDGCQVTRFVAHSDGTFTYDYGSDSSGTHPFGPTVFTAKDGDVVFYTVVNGGTDAASVPIALTRPDARISPQSAEIGSGEAVTYSVSVDNVPFGLEVTVLDAGGTVVTTGPGVAEGTAVLPPFVQWFPEPGLYYPRFFVRLTAAGSGDPYSSIDLLKVLQPSVWVT
ncbi:MAG: hypothetical protein GXY82_04580 [Methanospirillum sp.]|nr:hypothetical protein [Methanospirillum sp.]